MEIGIDLEKNSRFKNKSKRFLNRVFTENEILYANKYLDYSARLCAIWCVKEATIKAFSNAEFNLKDIEVCHDKNNKPIIVLNQKIQNELKKHNAKKINISLSHSKDYSTAVCIIE